MGVAALFVQSGGVYSARADIDTWDVGHDARRYAGPHPVVAHPPCARWGRYYGGSPTTWPRLTRGDDDGCFEAALTAVRRWGGVIEHPEGSSAWKAFGLAPPRRNEGWTPAGDGGWTCSVAQGSFGHRCLKPTWLYAHGVHDLPDLPLYPTNQVFEKVENLSRKAREATPPDFRDFLIDIARRAESTIHG